MVTWLSEAPPMNHKKERQLRFIPNSQFYCFIILTIVFIALADVMFAIIIVVVIVL